MEETEIGHSPKIPVLNLSEKVAYPAGEVLVNGEDLGEGLWDRLIDESLEEKQEKGVVVSRRNGGAKTGTIITGTEDSIYPPTERFWKRNDTRGRVFVHTHLVDVFAVGEQGIISTLPSQKDLEELFNRWDYNAFVILDAGGSGRTHLLVKGNLGNGISQVPPDFVRSRFAKKLEGQRAVDETVFSLATDLQGFGILYYLNEGRQKENNHLLFKIPRKKAF